jgi:exopolysaccharide biosynthesis polyprenyl glycosylphosphotransferase
MASVEMSVDGRAPWLDRDEADAHRARAGARTAGWLAGAAGGCLLAVDLCLVVGAFLLAHWARFILPAAEEEALGLEQYARLGLLVSLINAGLLALQGFYDPESVQGWFRRFHVVVSSVSTALVLTVAVSFFLGDQRFSRLWFAAGWGFAVGGLCLWRAIARRLYARLRDALAPAERVLIVGANELGQELAREMGLRYQVVGFVDNGSDLGAEATLPLLGPIARLEKLVHDLSIDEVVVALPSERREQVSRLIARGFHRRVKVKVVQELQGLRAHLPQRLEISQLGVHHYIGFASRAKVSWLKRAFDLLVGGLGVLVISPLMLLIAVAITLDSPGPVFYRQRRVGKDGREFMIYKFRSMHPDAERQLVALRGQNEASGPLFKMKRDPRVTRVGRLLRRLSLDELPQLFNVIKGEMSLVGPRPPVPQEVAQYEDWQHGRLRAVPGITGLWQVSGRSDVSFHDMVRLDLHYIRNWSLAMDLEILIRTVPAVLTSRGAY